MIITTDWWWQDGTYAPLVEQECSMFGCSYPTGWPDTCYLFDSESEGGWTCQAICDEALHETTDPRTEPPITDSGIPMLTAWSTVLSCLGLALASSITFLSIKPREESLSQEQPHVLQAYISMNITQWQHVDVLHT
jgi:hypothetical protein